MAAFLRLYRLETVPPGLYHDEAMNGNNAREVLETGRFAPFYPENGGREGLYINVSTLFLRFLGNQAWVLRLPAAIFGILTVWGVYLLAAELYSPPVGLLASFFLATSFWHITLSRLGLRAIGAPLFLTWTLYLLLVALRRQRQARPFVAIAILSGCIYGLGFYTYVPYRVTPVLVVPVLIYFGRKNAWLPSIFAATAAAAVAPLAVYFLAHPGTFFGRISTVSVIAVGHPGWELTLNVWRTGRMFFTRGDTNWRHNVAWRAELYWPVAILFASGVLMSLRFKDRSLAVLAWLIVAAVPVVFSAERLPHAVRSVLMIPPAVILAAVAGHALYSWLSQKVSQRSLELAAVVGLLTLCYEPYHTYFELWAKSPHLLDYFDERSVDVAAQINRLPRDVPKYVAVPASNPMVAQPVMFLTGSYTRAEQDATNIRYFSMPPGAACPQNAFCLLDYGQ